MFDKQHTWRLSEATNNTADLLFHGYSKKQGLAHESTFSPTIIQTWMPHYLDIRLIQQIKNSKPFQSFKSDIFCLQGFKFYIELCPNTTVKRLNLNPNFRAPFDLKTIESGKVATFSSDDTFTPYLDIPEPDTNEELNQCTPTATYSESSDSDCNLNFIAGAYYDMESDEIGFGELSKSSIFGDYGRLPLSKSHLSQESISMDLFDGLGADRNDNKQSYFEIYIHIVSVSPNISNITGSANIIFREKDIKINCEFSLNDTETWFRWTEGTGWDDENYLRFSDIQSLDSMTFDVEIPNELNIALLNETDNEIKSVNYFPVYTAPFLLNLGQFVWTIVSKEYELNYKSDSFKMNSMFEWHLQFDVETSDVRLSLEYLPENVSCVYVMCNILFKESDTEIMNEIYFKFDEDRLVCDGCDDNMLDALDALGIELLDEWTFTVEIQLIDVYDINGKAMRNKSDILVKNASDVGYNCAMEDDICSLLDTQHIFLKSYDDVTFLKSCNESAKCGNEIESENMDKFCLLI